MVPLGFNPHLLPEATQKITRAALSEELDIPKEHEKESKAVLEFLHQSAQRSLGSFEVHLPKARRQQSDAKPLDEETSTQFRLVSSVLPPQPISLVPFHTHAIPHQRPAEDTAHEEKLRRKRAQEIAVDANWVLSHSRVQKLPNTGSGSKTLTTSPSDIDLFQLPQFFVTECARLTASSMKTSPSSSTREEGTIVVKCCPVIHVADSTAQTNTPKRKQKRKRKAKPRERPPPSFFKPMQEWGGKSAGYAMGWGGSWPAHKPGPHRYRRDTMRQGITLAHLERIG